jgi:adiponectin receptor
MRQVRNVFWSWYLVRHRPANATTAANIWSHLLGALLFVALFARFFFWARLPDGLTFQDGLAVGVYFTGVVVCFVLSTIFHTFSDHSPHMHKFGNELDHLGIVLVMWGTGVSGAHFGFYHHHVIRNFYFALLTATAVGCGVFTLRPKFRRPTYRLVRFLMYAGLGASLFVPIVHGLFKFGWDELDDKMGLESFFGLGLINFSGSAVYASRVPERWFPRRFDLLGQSHNWMHVLVLTGALVRLNGLLEVAKRWREYGSLGGQS